MELIKVGITGQAGFIGTHLFNLLNLKDKVICSHFEDEFFDEKKKLDDFVKKCDAIVHLAAVNRHEDDDILFETNIELTRKLISSCESTNSKPHILFASSIQEQRDNPYGRSKLEGRRLLEAWAQRDEANFSGLIIPNVFGPFGTPFYNSFIATFCHQLSHGETPQIEIDGDVELIYVGELAEQIYRRILSVFHSDKIQIEETCIPPSAQRKVSAVLELLQTFKSLYFQHGNIPDLHENFEKHLFNTFVSYIDHGKYFPFRLTKHQDHRGSFAEIMRLNSGGQISFSTTKPGITRGNHFHTRKAERFAVLRGQARIQMRKVGTDKVLNFKLDGDMPAFVDMPIWYTHNITNIGEGELLTMFWINEQYDPSDDDTFFEEV